MFSLQLGSFHMPPRLCSKFFKLGFNSTWTKNFQIYKLGFEEAEEPEIKLPTFIGSWRKGNPRKNIYFFTDYVKAFGSVDHNKLWNLLKDLGLLDHLPCLLRNLYAGQEAIVRTGNWTINCFQIGKGVQQGCMLSPCLFNLHAEYIMQNTMLEESQSGIKTAGRNINNLRSADNATLWQKMKKN